MFKKSICFFLTLCMLMSLLWTMPAFARNDHVSFDVDSYDFESYTGTGVPAKNQGEGILDWSYNADGLEAYDMGGAHGTVVKLTDTTKDKGYLCYNVYGSISEAIRVDFSVNMPDLNDTRLIRIANGRSPVYPLQIRTDGKAKFFWDDSTIGDYTFETNKWYDISIHYTYENDYCEIAVNDGASTYTAKGILNYGGYNIASADVIEFGYWGDYSTESITYFDNIAVYFKTEPKAPQTEEETGGDFYSFDDYTGGVPVKNASTNNYWSHGGTSPEALDDGGEHGTVVKLTDAKNYTNLKYLVHGSISDAIQVDFSIKMPDLYGTRMIRLGDTSIGKYLLPLEIKVGGAVKLFMTDNINENEFKFEADRWYDVSIHYSYGKKYCEIYINDGDTDEILYAKSGTVVYEHNVPVTDAIWFGYDEVYAADKSGSVTYFDDITIAQSEAKVPKMVLGYDATEFVFKKDSEEINNITSGDITVSTDVSTIFDNPLDAQLYLALYDEAGNLVSVNATEISFGKEVATKETTINVPSDGDYKLKAMLWRTDMTPVIKPKLLHKRVVILKLDDLRDNTYERFIPWSVWAEQNNIKLNFGVICDTFTNGNQTCFDAIKTMGEKPTIELWCHGYDHDYHPDPISEFELSYEEQKQILENCLNLMKENTDIDFTSLGTPFNKMNEDTVNVLAEFPQIKAVLQTAYGADNEEINGATFVHLVNTACLEADTYKLDDLESIKSSYIAASQNAGYVVLQGHPWGWDGYNVTRDLNNLTRNDSEKFEELVLWLRDEMGVTFMSPTEYYDYIN